MILRGWKLIHLVSFTAAPPADQILAYLVYDQNPAKLLIFPSASDVLCVQCELAKISILTHLTDMDGKDNLLNINKLAL